MRSKISNTRQNKSSHHKSQRGASLVEYALLIALIACVGMVSVGQLGQLIGVGDPDNDKRSGFDEIRLALTGPADDN